MEQSLSVFHAYDIRGLSPQEIDEAFATRLARALITRFRPKRVLVGRDMRLTSPQLEDALVMQLLDLGVNVVRIGLCTTPMFNVTVGLQKGAVDLGVMITASHNPGTYNGFKIVRGDVSPVGQGSGMEELAEAFEGDATIPSSPYHGELVEDADALQRYVDHILSLAALPGEMPRMKIAIDAGNGMAGAILPAFLERLSWLEVVRLYFEPDGSFPNHEANPLKRETLKDLSATVVREGCVLGIAFDGDADRIGFVDEAGTPIPGDIMTALIGSELLRTHTGERILYDIRSSWATPEAIQVAGGVSEMSRVGQAFIKPQMRKGNAIFAGEVAMHYYFRDLFNVESGDLVMLLVLRRLAEQGRSSSELWKPLMRYAHSGEINFEIADKTAVLRRIRSTYEALATSVSDLDGIRMEFRDDAHPENDWWFNVRLSNTEPLVRLNLETRSAEMTAQKVEELSEVMKHGA